MSRVEKLRWPGRRPQVCHDQVGADEELGAGTAVHVALEQHVVAGRIVGDAGGAEFGVDVERGEGRGGQVVAQQVRQGQVGADEELGAGAAVHIALEQQVVAGRIVGDAGGAELGVDVEGGERCGGEVVAQQVRHGQVGADEELSAGAAVHIALEQDVERPGLRHRRRRQGHGGDEGSRKSSDVQLEVKHVLSPFDRLGGSSGDRRGFWICGRSSVSLRR